MAGVHGLQQVVAAFVADFAHDDPVGTMAESGGHKLAWRDGNLAGNRLDSLPANGVGMGDLQLGGLLDHDQPFMQRNVVEQRLHQSRLARAGSAADDAVLPLADEARQPYPEPAPAELPDAISSSEVNQRLNLRTVKRRAVDRRGSADDGDAGAVRQARIEDRILAGKVLAEDARDALNGGLQAVVGVRRRRAEYARRRRHDPRRRRSCR